MPTQKAFFYIFWVGLLFLAPLSSLEAKSPPFKKQIYLTQEKALKLVFPKTEKITSRSIEISSSNRKLIESKLKTVLKENEIKFYFGDNGSALILNELGKHYPITFIVGITPSGNVHKVAIMIYRERIGSQIRKKRFLKQFRNKNLSSPLEIHRDILHITGATISSWSVTSGVRKALLLNEVLLNQ